MKPVTKKVLLKLYFCFQCFVVTINIYCAILELNIALMMLILGLQYIPTLLVILSAYIIGFIYIATGPISVLATKNILQNKPLTKLQKFSAVIFPIITVPLYLYLIFKLFIK